MKKRILRNLFCVMAFAVICFGASQVFATADFDLKTPTTSKPYLAVMDFITSGTTTTTNKVVKNCKDVLIQLDVTSVPGTETLTLSLEYSLNDATYGSMTADYMVKTTSNPTYTFVTSGTVGTFTINSADYGGTHTNSLGGAYAALVTGSTSVYRATFPCEVYLKAKASLTNGAAGNNPAKWRISFIDVDPFGHNPKNP